MRPRRVLIAGVLAAGVAAIAFIMRDRRPAHVAPPVQFGLDDGSVHTLDLTDPAVLELRDLASAVGRSLEAL